MLHLAGPSQPPHESSKLRIENKQKNKDNSGEQLYQPGKRGVCAALQRRDPPASPQKKEKKPTFENVQFSCVACLLCGLDLWEYIGWGVNFREEMYCHQGLGLGLPNWVVSFGSGGTDHRYPPTPGGGGGGWPTVLGCTCWCDATTDTTNWAHI